MTTINDVYIMYKFTEGAKVESFDPADSSLQSIIDDRFDELCEKYGSEKNDYKIDSYDSDYIDPAEFSNLNDYGEYCENVEKFGEAFHLRYEDLGEITGSEFEDSYNGCWSSAEEFCQSMLDDCYSVPDFIANYIDMEKLTRDWMMDYSEYDSDDGTHVFRN